MSASLNLCIGKPNTCLSFKNILLFKPDAKEIVVVKRLRVYPKDHS